jgi:hypothetical protein
MNKNGIIMSFWRKKRKCSLFIGQRFREVGFNESEKLPCINRLATGHIKVCVSDRHTVTVQPVVLRIEVKMAAHELQDNCVFAEGVTSFFSLHFGQVKVICIETIMAEAVEGSGKEFVMHKVQGGIKCGSNYPVAESVVGKKIVTDRFVMQSVRQSHRMLRLRMKPS